MRRRPAVIVLAAIVAAALGLAAASLGAVGSVLLVSGPNDETEAGFPSEQVNPAISGDGRFIAFVGSVGAAAGPEEVSGIGVTGTGVFLREVGGPITPVDVPFGADSRGLGFEAGAPSISASGRYLAFASEDPDLSNEDRNSSTTPAGDTFPVRNIFVYDRASGAVDLVSRADGAKGVGGNEDSNLPSISADGRYVAFQTEATDFLHGSYGGVFVRDLRRHTTRPAASLRLHPGGALNGGYTPSISAHGRWVAFLTGAHFHHGNALEVAVRDMNGKRAVYASRANGRHGPLAAADCKLPAISANGRYVAFASKAKNLSRIDRDDVEDVFLRDLKANRTLLVSRGQGKRGAAGSGDSSNPSISADGRYVAFESYASNLGPADSGAIPDVFVRDMRSGRVFLASRADRAGAAANAPSANPAISADGRYVAFDSRGSNLTPADTLHATSIFRYQLLP
jgi:Tol biopolymer transport system component